MTQAGGSTRQAKVKQLRWAELHLLIASLEQILLSCTPQPQSLTSTCFLRGLRSLTTLAFLAGFFSSRSLSPSPLEELAEALLSNLGGRGTRLQQQLGALPPEREHSGWRTWQQHKGSSPVLCSSTGGSQTAAVVLCWAVPWGLCFLQRLLSQFPAHSMPWHPTGLSPT